ncbi:MAG: hypothetical protein ACKVQS_02670 [Fimbriimonadaceae bacterium]
MFHTNGVSESAVEQVEKKRGVHWAIKVWLLFHCFAVITRTIPLPQVEDVKRTEEPGFSPQKLNSAIKVANLNTFRQTSWGIPYYTESLGFWQYWDMFAPNPAQEDIWIDAEIEFADGSKSIEVYPRMYELNLAEKFVSERYRKYRERLGGDEYAWKWPHTALWFAARAWKNPENPPVRVTMRRQYYLVPKPPTVPNYKYTTYPFYTAVIDQVQLKEMKP